MAAEHNTEPAPTLMSVVDEFGALESRVLFYCAAAEKIAGEGLSAVELDPLIRGGDDLADYIFGFREMLDAYHAASKEGAK
ncbi:hypothetical protein [Acuticoccus sp. I52.16.1]|uniref:hypothetical protein n=1 Tax=Acuticoccus sp. I52.16.1 TaxID=2928472 RepID=UPI001FD0A742|nr:hypothetical protein [Acuticoccus sp. I52.16.1]UOM34869.1 hypothetical protein MRB58_01260 [Acuticoccus sp. I52.16.1]